MVDYKFIIFHLVYIMMCIEQAVNDDLKKVIVTTMKAHTASVELQTLACNVLGNAALIGIIASA